MREARHLVSEVGGRIEHAHAARHRSNDPPAPRTYRAAASEGRPHCERALNAAEGGIGNLVVLIGVVERWTIRVRSVGACEGVWAA